MWFEEVEVNKFPSSEKLVLVDADSMLYYSMPSIDELEYLSDEDGLKMSLESFLSLANVIKNACSSSNKYLYFFGCRRADNYRLHFSSNYKANRLKQEKPKFVEPLKQYIISNYSNAISCINVEADDAVAYLKGKYGDDCIVCSPDKDVLRQLSGAHFDYRKQVIVKTSSSDANRFLFLQMLAGDSTDGIRGLEKVGLKTADKMLSSTPSFDEVVAHYEQRGLGYEQARKTAYLVDISCLKDTLFDLKARTFAVLTLNLKY